MAVAAVMCLQPVLLSQHFSLLLGHRRGVSGGGAAGGSAGPPLGFGWGLRLENEGEKENGSGRGGSPRPRTRFPSQRLPLLSQAAIPPEP